LIVLEGKQAFHASQFGQGTGCARFEGALDIELGAAATSVMPLAGGEVEGAPSSMETMPLLARLATSYVGGVVIIAQLRVAPALLVKAPVDRHEVSAAQV